MTDRKKYVDNMKAKLDNWNKDIDGLEERVRTASSELKGEYTKQLETLKTKRDEAANKLAELQEESGSAWEDFKEGLDDTWDSVTHALSSAKDKILGKEEVK